MNKSVHPLVALGIVVFFGGVLAVKFWCDHQLLTMDRLMAIKLSPRQEIVVQLGSDLYVSDRDGNPIHQIALADIGVDDVVGDFGFFNNGDLLLVRDRGRLTVEEQLATVLRQPGQERHSDKARLHRCSTLTRICQEFGPALPDFYRSFRLYIDPVDERVYLSDTSRHTLWLLDADGQVLATAAGFHFPNQLLLRNGDLWVADTNHHTVRQVSAARESFGHELSTHSVRLDPPHIWPFALAVAGDHWWVMVAVNGMKDARVVRYDQGWRLTDSLELPARADPVALLSLDDRVLITDNRWFRIYQFDTAGNPMEDFAPAILADRLADLHQQAKTRQLTSWVFLGIFIASLLAGFMFALRQHLQDRREQQAHPVATSPGELPDQGMWLEPQRSFHAAGYGMLAIGALLIVSAIVLGFMAWKTGRHLQVSLLLALTGLSFSLIAVPMWRFRRYRLGIFSERVELQLGEGRCERFSYEHIRWTPRHIVLGKQVIPLGDGRHVGLFSYKLLQQHLLPRLVPESRIGPWKMTTLQWHSEDGTAKAVTLAMILLVMLYLATKAETISRWLTAL